AYKPRVLCSFIRNYITSDNCHLRTDLCLAGVRIYDRSVDGFICIDHRRCVLPQPIAGTFNRRRAADDELYGMVTVANELRWQHLADERHERRWVLNRLLGQVFHSADLL